MTEIREIGSFCSIDDRGYIANQSAPEKINKKFLKVIKLINEKCLSALPREVHSIYIRGSVPRGLDIEGVSDIDVIIVTYSNPQYIVLDWVEETEQYIDQKFSFINGVEIGISPLSEFDAAKYCSMIPFLLKTYGICIYGENIISKLPDYKPDISLANEHLIHLKSFIDAAKKGLTDNEDIEEIKGWCSWVMKVIVRSGGVLVIDEEQMYTRDLFPAFKIFCKHYPKKEQEMKKALWYSINPLSSSEEIVKFLNHFGSWIEEETEKWLNAYNPKRKMHLPLR